MVSIGLQHGTPLDILVDKFRDVRFEPAGFTGNPEIPLAKSLPDYIFRWLELEFITRKMVPSIDAPEEVTTIVPVVSRTPTQPKMSVVDFSGDSCSRCGGLTKRTGSCHTCTSCGETTGCG